MTLSQSITTASSSLPATNQKKVLLLSRLDGASLARLINAVRQSGCHVVLVATALGYNYSLNEKDYDDLGARIRRVYATVVDPPPVLTITGISQLLPFLQAVDPDLVISWHFPYQLTKSFLAHRSIKVNRHPSPLPLYRGSAVSYHPVSQQLSKWAVTWHYITEDYDMGNILIQEFFELSLPYGVSDFASQSLEIAFATVGKAIEMSLSGHPGTPQRQPSADEEQYVNPKLPTLAQRTLTSEMTCHQVWKSDCIM
jgi:folate-dependent phosphoribosylglycinamide formyltransferase PurN